MVSQILRPHDEADWAYMTVKVLREAEDGYLLVESTSIDSLKSPKQCRYCP